MDKLASHLLLQSLDCDFEMLHSIEPLFYRIRGREGRGSGREVEGDKTLFEH